MLGGLFTKQDLASIEEHGLRVKDVEAQLALFRKPPFRVTVLRPCTVGDGIRVIGEQGARTYVERYEEETLKGRCMKFVPASGAASRMFKDLLQCLAEGKGLSYDRLVRDAETGDRAARSCRAFADGIHRFAFASDLRSSLLREGHDLQALLADGKIEPVLRCLLFDPGLDYANLPKALLRFHDYPGGARTAFEEHLVEAAGYVADGRGNCPIHFTVSREHLSGFERLLRLAGPRYEKEHRVSYRVGFSVQKPSTDTVAVDLEGKPFRDSDGRILFRPGGHGALIENLNDLQGDILFIKNIDNVVPDRLKEPVIHWKKILGGLLISLQDRIFRYLDALENPSDRPDFLSKALRFMEEELQIASLDQAANMDRETLHAFVLARLNRPIRVCGMVRNVGEPGGGPFWVADRNGEASLQIVELSQTDPDSQAQQEILKRATHFNPVDLACGVRDRKGHPFDLHDFVDPAAVFIMKKSKDGRDLKALERPGLWNGGMARWITVFVEVPSETFAPVKTVNDLLRSEHQAR